MEWWKKTIIYECYPKSFLDTKGQGSGTLRGIINRLDYLASLNIGAIWLTPVYPSGGVDNGYDVTDYCDIDPAYGTMADMEELITEAKNRNIRIIMDLVFNHSSDQHPWFIESQSSRDNDKSDWYIWQDPKENGDPPSNYRSIFGGSAWEYNEKRKQYYLHTFAIGQPDLNWENPKLRKAIADIVRFWIHKGVEGFRIDAIVYIKKPSEFMNGEADGEDGLTSIHDMIADTDGILDLLHEFRNAIGDKEFFTISEANGIRPEEFKDWTGENGVFDCLIEFPHVRPEFPHKEEWCYPREFRLAYLKEVINNSQKATAENGWYPIFFENHDSSRCIDHYFHNPSDPMSAGKVMAVLLYTLRGTPLLFQGQEIGMRNVAWKDISEYNDISSYGQYEFALNEGFSKEEAMEFIRRFSRDSARTPMQWDDQKNAGFSTGTPWLKVNENYQEINVEKQDQDPDSLLNWYRKLAILRQEYPVLIEGDYKPILIDDPDIFAYERKNDDCLIRVFLNFSDKTVSYDEAYEKGFSVLLCSDTQHQSGKLKALESLVLIADQLL